MTQTHLDTKSPTISETLHAATEKLVNGSDTPRLDSEILLCHALNKSREYFYTWPEKTLKTHELKSFEKLITKRQQGQPIAYLIGEKEFWSRPFMVNEHTLIPRPDTERLIEVAIDLFEKNASLNILDLGTGSGNIATTLSKHFPNSSILASDNSKAALQMATANAKAHKANVNFIESDWFSAIGDRTFDLIIANPPYIAENDPHLNKGDVRFEPQSALIAKNKGLADIDIIVQKAKDYLKPTGCILIEHGYDQGANVRTLMEHYHYNGIKTYQDLALKDRCTFAKIESNPL